jgi:hypothetical protein
MLAEHRGVAKKRCLMLTFYHLLYYYAQVFREFVLSCCIHILTCREASATFVSLMEAQTV